MAQCKRCGVKASAWEATCGKVYRKAGYADAQANTLNIEETFTGFETAGLCEDCTKEMVNVVDLSKTRLSQIIPVLILLPAVWYTYQKMYVPALVFLGIAIVAGILLALLGSIPRARMKKSLMGEGRSLLLARMTPDKGTVLVPFGDGLYKDRKHFGKCNPWLIPDISEAIYSRLAETGKWKDGEIPTPGIPAAAAKIQTAASPRLTYDNRHESLVTDSGRQLCSAYDKTPAGFDKGSSGADSIVRIGERLNSAGGLELMKIVFELFSLAFHALGNEAAIRNLDALWDGIGPWRAAQAEPEAQENPQ